MQKYFIHFVIAILSLTACSTKKHRDLHDPINAKGDRKGEKPDQKNPKAPPMNWFTLDLDQDSVPGTSADRAYSLSFVKTGVSPVLVAVIDSGIDIHHEDLAARIWKNMAELNGTPGVDDDGNGYIDDVSGWNFLGSYDPKGQATFISHERLEVTRESARMKALKEDREKQGLTLTDDEQAYYNQVTKEVADTLDETQVSLQDARELKTEIQSLLSRVSTLSSKPYLEVTLDQIKSVVTTSNDEKEAVEELIQLFSNSRLRSTAQLERRINYYDALIKYYYNESFDPRQTIIGDDPNDFSNKNYGNNVVEGPLNSEGIYEEASHGTHVAGIIGAVRDNNIGIRGIAHDVQILPLRAVPDGDEQDKDIVNSVYYAINAGARIISMSFGKGLSPHKDQVDRAFQLAAQNNVLLFHAAGNDSKNNDKEPSFPNSYIGNNPLNSISTWFDIGASSAYPDKNLVAPFSNFGSVSVELFSPGVDIYSTVPGNEYDSYSGTSMATPAAAGVAALVWSQFPSLTARELKDILMQSVITFPNLEVLSPEDQKPIVFEQLSKTGGIINAYTALIKACEYTSIQIDCK